MTWKCPAIAAPSEIHRRLAEARQAQLTKPPSSLGRIEELAVRLAALQGTEFPTLERVRIVVFAADHGVAEERVSAYPQEVTQAMLGNFAAGGAAISVLAGHLGANLEVVDVGAKTSVACSGIVLDRAGNGTANFTQGAAMSREQLHKALQAGGAAAMRAAATENQLLIGGEMGIGNSTSASALACALLGEKPERLAGPGTGLDAAGVRHKCAVIAAGLARHDGCLYEPLEILRRLGGFEIAALAGAFLHAAAARLPVLVDGFIAGVAALLAVRLNPACADWLIFSHRSAEPGHALVLEALNAEPLLDLNLRLGEGSGAALAVPLLRAACTLHNGMATFAEAGVPGA